MNLALMIWNLERKKEYRLYDDKRKLVRVGDTIKFLKLTNLDEEFIVDVKNIETFDNWFDCYSKYYEEDFKERYASIDAVVQDTYDGCYYSKEESGKNDISNNWKNWKYRRKGTI